MTPLSRITALVLLAAAFSAAQAMHVPSRCSVDLNAAGGPCASLLGARAPYDRISGSRGGPTPFTATDIELWFDLSAVDPDTHFDGAGVHSYSWVWIEDDVPLGAQLPIELAGTDLGAFVGGPLLLSMPPGRDTPLVLIPRTNGQGTLPPCFARTANSQGPRCTPSDFFALDVASVPIPAPVLLLLPALLGLVALKRRKSA